MKPDLRAASGFDIKAVREGLAALWNPDHTSTAQPETIRACSVNFILPIAPNALNAWQDRLAELSRRVPSRIVLLEQNHTAGAPPLEAHVSATCHRRKEGVLVCSEMVHILAAPDAAARLPSLCRSLAVSDLPLVLLALDEPRLPRAVSRSLHELSDHVIVDTSCSAANSRDEGYGDGDLLWPGLLGWRTALGRFVTSCRPFDPESVAGVRLAGNARTARLFAGWLGDLLRWRIETPAGGARVTTGASRRPVKLEFVHTQGGDCGLERIDIALSGETAAGISVVAQRDRMLRIQAHFGDTRIDTSTSFAPLTFAEKVARIVHSHGMDLIYARARALAQSLSG